MKRLSHQDFAQNQIQNAVAHPLAAAPSSPVAGQFYYDTTTGRFIFRGASAWIDPTDRANHSGTQVAASISNLAATVQAYRLDQFVAPTAAVAFNGQKITGLAEPTLAQDAATKNYVDTNLAAAANVSVIKGAVRAVVSTNVNLAAPGASLDGLAAAAGQVFFLAGQTTGSQNGPYVFATSSTPMVRATNWDTTGEAVIGSYWVVNEGTHADQFALLSNDTFTLGTTTATLVYTSSGTAYSPGNGILIGGSTISVDPAVVTRKVSANVGDGTATSIVVTHGLGTLDVQVQVVEISTGATVECDHTRNSTTQVTLSFVVAPTSNQYRVIVQG